MDLRSFNKRYAKNLQELAILSCSKVCKKWKKCVPFFEDMRDACQSEWYVKGKYEKVDDKKFIDRQCRSYISKTLYYIATKLCLRRIFPKEFLVDVYPEMIGEEEPPDNTSVFGWLTPIVDELTERHRSVIIHYYWFETPNKDIAKMLGVHPSRVSQIVDEARKTIKKHPAFIEVYGEED